MKKGFEWSVNILIAVILAVAAAGYVFSSLTGTAKAETNTDKASLTTSCNSDSNCINNLDGSRCIIVYPGDSTAFCGCLTKEDCTGKRGGICGSNDKCV